MLFSSAYLPNMAILSLNPTGLGKDHLPHPPSSCCAAGTLPVEWNISPTKALCTGTWQLETSYWQTTSNARFDHLYANIRCVGKHAVFSDWGFWFVSRPGWEPILHHTQGNHPTEMVGSRGKAVNWWTVYLTTLYPKPIQAFMYGKFSTSSDVYSYGMLLYEIWSCGCKPMANVGMEEVCWSIPILCSFQITFLFGTQAKRLLTEGYCQPPPPGCPRGIYEVMVQCW